MKILNLLVVLILLAAVSTSFGQISGSAHDFSAEAYTTEICNVCHTPHNADVSVLEAPLWNHELSTEIYTVYNNSSLQATVGQPAGISKLCLSCHDGSVAIDNFGGTTTGTHFITSGDVGNNLSDDHPISFTYDATLATDDGELADPATANSGLGSTIHDDLLSDGELECSSCHDVHNSLGHANLLVLDNTGSALCLTCHIK